MISGYPRLVVQFGRVAVAVLERLDGRGELSEDSGIAAQRLCRVAHAGRSPCFESAAGNDEVGVNNVAGQETERLSGGME